jgi:hypothetical protein
MSSNSICAAGPGLENARRIARQASTLLASTGLAVFGNYMRGEAQRREQKVWAILASGKRAVILRFERIAEYPMVSEKGI